MRRHIHQQKHQNKIRQDVSIDYVCGCGRPFPIEGPLYFCQGCVVLRCIMCVTQEIDSFFCPNCLENMSSTDVSHFKNRCKKCFECPCCSSPLAFHANQSETGSQNSNESETEKTVTYLRCGFCQWDSLSINLKADSANELIGMTIEKAKYSSDANVNSPSIPKDDVARIIERYQKDEKDKAKERKSLSRMKRSSILFMNKAQLLASLNSSAPIQRPPPTKLEDLERALEGKQDSLKKKVITRQEDYIEEETLLQSLRNPEIDLSTITTLEQRHNHPSIQPRSAKELVPKRVSLFSRRSKHCGSCDKLLIKPDLNAAKIEFKRQHVALFYIPKVTISSLPPLSLNEESEVIVRLVNPLHSIMTVTIDHFNDQHNSVEFRTPLPLSTFISPKDHDDEDESDDIKELKAKDNASLIFGRKSNWVQLKFNLKPLHPTNLKFSLLLNIKYKSAGTSEQEFKFPIQFALGDITVWSKEQSKHMIHQQQQQQQQQQNTNTVVASSAPTPSTTTTTSTPPVQSTNAPVVAATSGTTKQPAAQPQPTVGTTIPTPATTTTVQQPKSVSVKKDVTSSVANPLGVNSDEEEEDEY